MGSRERTKPINIYSNGRTSNTGDPDAKLLAKYYFSENDGARFMRRGSETELHLSFEEQATPETIDSVLDKLSNREVSPKVISILTHLVKEGTIKDGTYLI